MKNKFELFTLEELEVLMEALCSVGGIEASELLLKVENQLSVARDSRRMNRVSE